MEVIPFMLHFAARRCAGRENRPALGLSLAIALILVAATPVQPALAAACTGAKVAEFPVTMTNMKPVMTAKINDVDVQFIIDCGAFYSMISAPSVAALNLTAYPAPFGFFVRASAAEPRAHRSPRLRRSRWRACPCTISIS